LQEEVLILVSEIPRQILCPANLSSTIGEPPVASAIREASEEASLPASYVVKHISSAGSITFSHRSPAGWLLPGHYHAFDLPLPTDLSISPKVNAKDGEVESFELLDIQECLNGLLAGKFKPSSALAILNFMVRRGLYTPEVDVEYDAVLKAMRMDLIVPIP
jgi:8-oxo-dGTP pyrophosphatase MutT (NUDIX family)